MPEEKSAIIQIVIVGTVILALVAIFIVSFMLLYTKKHNRYLMEKKEMQSRFQQELLRTQMEMQEQTFNTISQEIHDNVGQILSLAKVQLNIIDQKKTANKAAITEVKENISKAMTDLRDIAKSLSTDRIQLVDFTEAVEQELNRISRTGIIRSFIKVEGQTQNLPQQKKLILFRIIQESLQNIIKHAQATTIQVLFHCMDDKMKVMVKDNGKGFDTDEINSNGLGLQNIINRTQLIGGIADIKSSAGEGTTITLIIPYA